MKTAWRLSLAVAAWALSIPAMGVAASWLQRSAFPSIQAEVVMAHAIELTMVLLAALIYWRCVPPAPNPWRRLLDLAAFASLLGIVGYCALGAGVVLVNLLFGL